MICKLCGGSFDREKMCGKHKLYCTHCYSNKQAYIQSRRFKLESFRALPLEYKEKKSIQLINEARYRYGPNLYVSYSGGKDSTVLSHLARSVCPDIVHIFSNTTCEYPETLEHVHWEQDKNRMNLLTVTPYDRYHKPWNFRRVVTEYGFPLFSKEIANSIRTYRHARSEITRSHSLEYIRRRFPKYEQYIDCNISDLCCEKLKKGPIKRLSKQLGLDCAIIGTLAEESRQREYDWIKYGCNVFDEKEEGQCRPLSFWTESDIYHYIDKYHLKINSLYEKDYNRNGCMFCGFGIKYDIVNGLNRYQRLQITHPKSYEYFIKNFSAILDSCKIIY